MCRGLGVATCHWGWVLRASRLEPFEFLFFASCLWFKMWPFSCSWHQSLELAVRLHDSDNDEFLILWNCKFQINCSFYKLPLSRCLIAAIDTQLRQPSTKELRAPGLRFLYKVDQCVLMPFCFTLFFFRHVWGFDLHLYMDLSFLLRKKPRFELSNILLELNKVILRSKVRVFS